MTTSSGVSRSKTCTACGRDMLIDAFRKFGRGRRQVCTDCEGGGSVKSAAPKTVGEVAEKHARKANGAPVAAVIASSLEVERGWGFRASWENGCLQLEQDQVDDDGDDVTVATVLSRTEAERLAQFIREGAS